MKRLIFLSITFALAMASCKKEINQDSDASDYSAGLTLNGGIVATKQFKNMSRLELVAATPFIARDVRADGLTRKAAFNLQYSIPF